MASVMLVLGYIQSRQISCHLIFCQNNAKNGMFIAALHYYYMVIPNNHHISGQFHEWHLWPFKQEGF